MRPSQLSSQENPLVHPTRCSPLVAFLLAALCSQTNLAVVPPGDPKAPTPVSALIAEGTRSAIETPRQTIIRDQAAFDALWAEHSTHENPAPKIPSVNFAADSVVAVFAGHQPSGGHALALTDLNKTSGGWELRLSLISPGPDCMTTQVMTQPWVMVRVPGHELPVNIQITPTKRSCGQ
jgi:hypothetical protein